MSEPNPERAIEAPEILARAGRVLALAEDQHVQELARLIQSLGMKLIDVEGEIDEMESGPD